jgi:hypothetical protein
VNNAAGAAPVRRTIPLARRRYDWVLLAFFAVNLCFITYFVDIEQLTVGNAFRFHYPAWPPPAIVNLVHGYGRHYDPLLLARPAFWRMVARREEPLAQAAARLRREYSVEVVTVATDLATQGAAGQVARAAEGRPPL